MAIYNFLYGAFDSQWYENDNRLGYGFLAGRLIWTDFLRQPIDRFEESFYRFAEFLQIQIFSREWNEVYDLIQFVIDVPGFTISIDNLNKVLERDMSGFRVSGSLIVPISDEIELETIENALSIQDPFAGARTHIRDGLQKLSKKPDPDLRNAITEAISAVESAARVITGSQKATLAEALKILEKRGHVHQALKEAWLKLYGYTSDEQGLRHAMTEDPKVDFATAKYMLVSCAAFVNFLATPIGQS